MPTNSFAATAVAALCGGLLVAPSAMAAPQHQHGGSPAASHADMQRGEPEKTDAANGETVIKVGKSGDIKFTVETLVGETRLLPGMYLIQHRVHGTDHVLHFEGRTTANVGCRLEMLDHKASVTQVHTAHEGGTVRVTKVLIRGENVAHLF